MGYNLRNRKSAPSPTIASEAQPVRKRVKKTDGMKTWADEMGSSLLATLSKHAIKKVSDFKKFETMKAAKESLNMTESNPWIELFMYVAKTPAKEMEATKTEIDYWRSSSKTKSPMTSPVASNLKSTSISTPTSTTTPNISIPKSPTKSPIPKSPVNSLQAAAFVPLPVSPIGWDKKKGSAVSPLPSPPSQKKNESHLLHPSHGMERPSDPRPKRMATSPSLSPVATSPRSLPSKAGVRRPSIDELKEGKSILTHLPTGKALVDSGILRDRSVLTSQKQNLRRTPLTPTQPKSTTTATSPKIRSPTKDWHVGPAMQSSITSPTKREGGDLEADWSRQKKLKTDHSPMSLSPKANGNGNGNGSQHGSMPSLSFSFGSASPKLRYY